MPVFREISEAAGDEMAAALELEQLDQDLYRSVSTTARYSRRQAPQHDQEHGVARCDISRPKTVRQG